MDPIKRLKFFVRLQHIIWENMIELWRNHLQAVHGEKPNTSPDRCQELVAQINDLHRMRSLTLAAHRDSYFHESVEDYTAQATNSQMHKYLQRYRPVVLNSMKTAQRHITTAISIRRFFLPRSTPAQQMIAQREDEEHHHHKHTRIRTSTTPRITAFFPVIQPKPTP